MKIYIRIIVSIIVAVLLVSLNSISDYILEKHQEKIYSSIIGKISKEKKDELYEYNMKYYKDINNIIKFTSTKLKKYEEVNIKNKIILFVIKIFINTIVVFIVITILTQNIIINKLKNNKARRNYAQQAGGADK